MAKRNPIREGDKFKDVHGEVWTVFEDLRFGAGYWVHSSNRRIQMVLKRPSLEAMVRVHEERSAA